MSIDLDEVKRIAALAALDLRDDEAERFASDLSAVLQHIEELRAVTEVPEASEAEAAVTTTGERLTADPAALRDGAPALADDHFVFPRAVRGAS